MGIRSVVNVLKQRGPLSRKERKSIKLGVTCEGLDVGVEKEAA